MNFFLRELRFCPTFFAFKGNPLPFILLFLPAPFRPTYLVCFIYSLYLICIIYIYVYIYNTIIIRNVELLDFAAPLLVGALMQNPKNRNYASIVATLFHNKIYIRTILVNT